MSVYKYNKYKISINKDSAKTQGLQCGDIVRRQYFDGKNVIYSLLCVLEHGIDKDGKAYFIGALLEGDPPASEELLNFVRVTNLFNEDRSGALYLTSSDSESPYMDVIDGIAKNKTLCYPTNLGDTDSIDSTSQYIVDGKEYVDTKYNLSVNTNYRVLELTKNELELNSEVFVGIKQEFYQYIANPNRVLISYKIKSTRNITANATLEYVNGSRIDGSIDVSITEDWQYKFHVITVDYSGRHLRSFNLNLNNGLQEGDVIQISDLNIILLSSVANFGDGSQTRIGKMTGVVDPVFGTLKGYGGYMQRLYASRSAHISGTLTAGDENGFASTFYAGRIHKNAFINSLDCNFKTSVTVNNTLISPTGVGNVYNIANGTIITAQKNEWLLRKVGKKYTFSFWLYAKKTGNIVISQNDISIGSINIPEIDVEQWKRQNVTFELCPSTEDLLLKFESTIADLAFTSPQLEAGDDVTQYQPTDNTLSETDDFGAWMSRGGIGGTIQNPLLKLNYDGAGAIGSRTGSFLLKSNGSGHLANGNIAWTEQGKVLFGKDVTLNWDNLGSSAQDQMANRYMKIIGDDTFTIIGQESNSGVSCSPTQITLGLQEIGFSSSSSQRQWYYKYHGEFVAIKGANGTTLTITPDSEWWDSESIVTFQCVITLNEERTYTDTFTVKKQFVQGYTVEVTSSQGASFQNGNCNTTLTAQVYYQGKLVDNEYALSHFQFVWRCYDAKTRQIKDLDGIAVDNQLSLNYTLNSSEIFSCELVTADNFDYSFPIIF